MISGIDVTERRNYTCKEDTEDPTIWTLGVMTKRILMKLAKKSTETNAIELVYDTVKVGLKGISNFKIAGKEVEFKTEESVELGVEVVSQSVLDAIPYTVIAELSDEIITNSKLTGAEAKN